MARNRKRRHERMPDGRGDAPGAEPSVAIARRQRPAEADTDIDTEPDTIRDRDSSEARAHRDRLADDRDRRRLAADDAPTDRDRGHLAADDTPTDRDRGHLADDDDGGGGPGNGSRAVARDDSDEGGDGGSLARGHAIVPAPGPATRVIAFLQGSWRELQRVQWPDRPQVMQATGVVIGFVIVASVFLGVSDFVATKLVHFILR